MNKPQIVHEQGQIIVIPGTSRLLAKARIALNLTRKTNRWAVVTLTATPDGVFLHPHGEAIGLEKASAAAKDLEAGGLPKLLPGPGVDAVERYRQACVEFAEARRNYLLAPPGANVGFVETDAAWAVVEDARLGLEKP